ncbi:MAG: hypothetical protein R3F30_14070 [Planctomycetota bacterium]
MSLARALFPDPPRQFPGKRGLKISLRAVHVLAAALLLGAWVHEAGADERTRALLLTAGSGAAILLLDLYESCAFALQVRGLVLLVKLAGVALLPVLAGGQAVLLGALVLLSVLSSHAPSKVRYHLLVGRGRVRGSSSHG